MKVLLIFHFVPVVLGCESDGSLKDSDEVGYIVVAYLRGDVGDAVMGCHEQSLGTLDACADSISFVYTVQSFLGVFHEERGYNPNESLQLHFLEAVHLGVSGNVV